jgi:hypothetical protein
MPSAYGKKQLAAIARATEPVVKPGAAGVKRYLVAESGERADGYAWNNIVGRTQSKEPPPEA